MHPAGARALRLVAALVAIGAAGTCAVQLASWVPVWPLALIEHFRVQLLVGGVLVVAACVAVRSRWLDGAALATLLHLCWLVPDLSRVPRAVPPAGRSVRVLLLNVLSSNTHFEDVRRLIADADADVIALAEVRDNWLAELAPALTGYPARVEHARTDNFGLALYARGGTLAGGVETTGLFPSIVATLSFEGGADGVGLVLTHPMPPINGYFLDLLDRQLGIVAERARALGPHAVILGDLNSTPWSRPFRHLVAASGFCDTRAGFGLQASFPAAFAPMRIPIDHALVTCNIGVRGRRIERDVGSDHLPVVIDLVVPR